MRFLRRRLGTIILFFADIVILFLTLLIAIILRDILPNIIPWFPAFSRDITYAWWFFPVWLFMLAYEGAYTRQFTFWDEVKLIWKTTFFSTIAILSIVFIGKIGTVSRTVVILNGVLSLAIFPLLRIFIKRKLIVAGLLKRRVLILGANERGKLALKALQNEPNLGYEVMGFIDDFQNKDRITINGLRVHRGLEHVEQYITRCDIQDVVIALPEQDKEFLAKLVTRLQHKATSVLYFPDYSAGLAVIGTEIRHFFHDQAFALQIKNNLAEPFNYITKKIFDYLVGFLLFLILSIPLAVIALAIRFTSPGPAVYSHARVGKNGKLFLCYKFRTMYRDAEERLKDILSKDEKARQEWDTYRKLSNDPRITPLGAILRKTSLDELPQILNVLRGEMSLVGPRPVTQEEIDKYYRDRAGLCFSVLPGITGLWQVSGGSNTSFDYRILLDVWYVRNWNLWLNIVILLKTIYVVMARQGAR